MYLISSYHHASKNKYYRKVIQQFKLTNIDKIYIIFEPQWDLLTPKYNDLIIYQINLHITLPAAGITEKN